MGGKFVTKRKALVDFKFPELDHNKKITWICHVDETSKPEQALCDVIIGMDLMTELGMHVNTHTKEIVWGERTAPLVRRGECQSKERLHVACHMAVNPTVMEAEARQACILDADCSKADVTQHVRTL